MKRVFLPLIACTVVLVSCKKDYTCSCTETVTETSANWNEVYTSTSTTTVKGVKKKFVEDELECYTTEYSEVEPDVYVGLDNNGFPIFEDVTVTYTNDCSISN